MRALVVDDSAVARRIVGRIVAGLGFEVVEAADGEEALACLGRYDDVGADEYLMKPFTADHLVAKLELLGVSP